MAFVPSTTFSKAFLGSCHEWSSSIHGVNTFPHRMHPARRARRSHQHISPPFTLIKATASLSESDRKQQLLDALSVIIDPDLYQDIVTLGFIKEIQFSPSETETTLYDVSFDVELTTPACPVKETFQRDCQKVAEELLWVSKANVRMTAIAPDANQPTSTGVLDYVNAIVAVASCKGGVGKSTTAVNLAFSLAAQGARVGIMDADIYGPSLPTLVKPDDRAVQFKDGRIQPLEANGVKLMSFGYVNPDSAIMRGPMIANVLNQLLMTTKWGVLDYLIIDLPPGTGDIQLTLSQIVNLTAAVIVTTPQRLSFVDVVKGLDMFNKVSVPSIAVVENMAYFVAPDTGNKHYIFGSGHKDRLIQQYGLENSFSMPIDAELCEKSDNGIPYVVANPDSLVSQAYQDMAASVAREVSKIKFGGFQIPEITFDEESKYIIVKYQANDDEPQKVWPAELRRQCRCALCVDEMTGKQKLNPDDVSETIKPVKISPVGNYAVDIAWSDGHPSLYPYSRFVDNWKSAPVKIVDREEQTKVEAAVGQ